ncbi:hypothetical protein BJ742DRAFT_218708 [Cladochytrium replicatum]|nr:hypothetical protein BJ742DRAFT_218708 [Cladochytrium replicatum]
MQKRKRTDEAGEDVEAAAAFAFLPTDSESSESSESSDSENRSLLDRMLALPDEPEFTQYAQSFHDDAFDFQTSDSDSTSSSQLQTMLDALKELETTPAPHSSDDDDDDDAAQNPDRHASKKDRSKRMLIADSCRTLVSIMYNTKDDTVRRMFKQPPLKTVKEPWYRPSAWPLPSGDIPSEFMEGRYCDDPFEDEDLLHGGSTDTWGSNVDSELLMPKSILPSDFVQTKKQKDQPENNTSPQTGFGTPGLRREVALLMRELSLIPSNGGSNPSFSRSAHPADVDRVTQTIQNVFTSVADTYREKVIQSLQR